MLQAGINNTDEKDWENGFAFDSSMATMVYGAASGVSSAYMTNHGASETGTMSNRMNATLMKNFTSALIENTIILSYQLGRGDSFKDAALSWNWGNMGYSFNDLAGNIGTMYGERTGKAFGWERQKSSRPMTEEERREKEKAADPLRSLNDLLNLAWQGLRGAGSALASAWDEVGGFFESVGNWASGGEFAADDSPEMQKMRDIEMSKAMWASGEMQREIDIRESQRMWADGSIEKVIVDGYADDILGNFYKDSRETTTAKIAYLELLGLNTTEIKSQVLEMRNTLNKNSNSIRLSDWDINGLQVTGGANIPYLNNNSGTAITINYDTGIVDVNGKIDIEAMKELRLYEIEIALAKAALVSGTIALGGELLSPYLAPVIGNALNVLKLGDRAKQIYNTIGGANTLAKTSLDMSFGFTQGIAGYSINNLDNFNINDALAVGGIQAGAALVSNIWGAYANMPGATILGAKIGTGIDYTVTGAIGAGGNALSQLYLINSSSDIKLSQTAWSAGTSIFGKYISTSVTNQGAFNYWWSSSGLAKTSLFIPSVTGNWMIKEYWKERERNKR